MNELDRFGELLMRKVRDEALKDFGGVLSGKCPPVYREAFKFLNDANLTREESIQRAAEVAVDFCLLNLLSMLEIGTDDEFELVARVESGCVPLRMLSDGLTGEIVTTDGWAGRFSKFRLSPITDD